MIKSFTITLTVLTSSSAFSYTKENLPQKMNTSSIQEILFFNTMKSFMISPLKEKSFQEQVKNQNGDLSLAQKDLASNYGKKINNLYFEKIVPKEIDIDTFFSSSKNETITSNNSQAIYTKKLVNLEPAKEKFLIADANDDVNYVFYAPKATAVYTIDKKETEAKNWMIENSHETDSYRYKILTKPGSKYVPNPMLSFRNSKNEFNIELEHGKFKRKEVKYQLFRARFFVQEEKTLSYGFSDFYLNDLSNLHYRYKEETKESQIDVSLKKSFQGVYFFHKTVDKSNQYGINLIKSF